MNKRKNRKKQLPLFIFFSNKKLPVLYCAVFFLSLCFLPEAFSSVQINSTRIVYHAKKKNISVQVMNPGKTPVLLQSWIDDGRKNVSPDLLKVPFLLTPPLSRVEADTGQTLRLSYTGESLPESKESVYWLNVLEIPPVDTKNKNHVQVSFRSRIKIFFRPSSLNDEGAQNAISQLKYDFDKNKIKILNSSPYFVSAVSFTIRHGGKKTIVPADMIAPYEDSEITLPVSILTASPDSVMVDAINDYGAPVKAPVNLRYN